MTEIVVPNEMAKALGVSGLTFRNWLRSEHDAGHPLLAGHEYRRHYRFSRREADQLMAEYLAAAGRARTPGQPYRGTATGPNKPTPPAASPSYADTSLRCAPGPAATEAATGPASPFAGLTFSGDAGHRVTESWMGEEVTTLADLLRPGLRAVVVGINPAPVSVAAGHHYQGQSGKRFLARLVQADVLDLAGEGYEDDQACAQDIGFTDAVKRPTAGADGLRPGELAHGRELLKARLAEFAAPRVIFTFKKAAVALLGQFDGHGLLQNRTLGGAEVFVMPGPMERIDRVERALRDLAGWWGADAT